jgi:tRNA-modifying protein YgfZ
MAQALLDGWRAFLLAGPDRKTFLHGLVTNDVNGLSPGRELPCCLLTPKGMMQGLLWVYDRPDGLLLVSPPECASNVEGALRKVLPLSESTLEADARPVYWTDGPGELPFSALGAGGALAFQPPAGPPLDAAALERRRVENALPRYGVDVGPDTIPLEAGLERAISYTKGCYMGQETISRIHHMGHVNRLLVKVKLGGSPPSLPAAVTAGGKEAGRLTSVAGDLGLAMLKADLAAEGTPLSAGDARLSVTA